ncbi:MAG TPA: SMP-30/gluconolactonase/LRE family protein, partial [Acidimicrobiales bacterium]|nr:SMP-30/gluconolactonase/LRE family protein [Acidimicrobiales bacterium]
MRPRASTRRSLGRSIFATALVVGLLATVPGAPSAGAQAAPGAWTITTVAGTDRGFSGDGGPATSAQLALPLGTKVDAQGNVYISDTANNRVRKVDPSGKITTVAGTGTRGFSGDGGPATSAQLASPWGLEFDSLGNLYVADNANRRIRKIDADGNITTVAGGGRFGRSNGDGGAATAAFLLGPQDVAFDAAGNLYIAEWGRHRIRKVDADGTITTVAGTTSGFSGDGGPATAAPLYAPSGIAFDPSGNLYIADAFNHRVRKVDADGIITTVAGTGERFPFSGDGGPATAAILSYPNDVAVQGSGNVFVADASNNAIRRIDTSGTIHTVAGTPPMQGSQGDGGFAPYAGLREPAAMSFDDAGNLYIADAQNHRIRRLETSYLWISSDPAPSKVGETFTYTLNVSGLPATATGVNVTAALAPQVAFVGATASQGSCANNPGTVTCDLGTVEPGATATVEITVTAQGAGVIPISATVSSEPEVIPGNRTATAYTKVSAANCGQTITANTVLSENIGPCAGNGVLIGADGITFDLGGKRIFGFPHAGDGHEAGIRVQDRSGVTVKNGTVTDFDAGVVVEGGGSNAVTGMTIRDNIGPDFHGSELGDGVAIIESPGNVVANNVLT